MSVLTNSDMGDVIFNFSYLISLNQKITFKEFAQVVERSNCSLQAIELVKFLKVTDGHIIKNALGHIYMKETTETTRIKCQIKYLK